MLNAAVTRVKGALLHSDERMVYQMALVGLVSGALCYLCLLLQQLGLLFPAELEIVRAASLCFAFGLFLATTGLVLPLTGLTVRTRTWFQRVLAVPAYYAFPVEIIQVFRGLDPRFNEGPFLTHVLPGIVYGALFGFVILMYVWLTAQFFTAKSYRTNPLLVLGIRYGLLSSMAGFGSGVWMALIQGRYIGEQGDIMGVHFLGFHGLQAVPVLALLLLRLPDVQPLRYVHAAGSLWLLLSMYSVLPTALGRSLLDFTEPLNAPLYVLLAAWGAVTVRVVLLLARSRTSSKQPELPASS
ncbi:hypothetical protein [Paenibacillus sp. YYML68]|uniref:hypothetical protein n=1 Tax=Paenibacillus sp. YYML68 TaxID=2909250 RepID=UPI0024922FF3|nr:hypothetical protein [Paenibacillus sp. YYML68]